MSFKKSFVWLYFTKEGPKKARCNVNDCGKLFSAGSGTSNLSTHLKAFHAIVDKGVDQAGSSGAGAEADNDEVKQKVKRQKTIHECFELTSFEETIARLAAKDGLSFKQITECQYLRHSLAGDFPSSTILKNQSAMADIVEKFYKNSKDKTVQKLEKLKNEGMRFSATLDEWTSLKNIRYMNINIHYATSMNKTEYINLGMIRIEGSCPAERMSELVRKAFGKFASNQNSFILVYREAE